MGLDFLLFTDNWEINIVTEAESGYCLYVTFRFAILRQPANRSIHH